MRDGSLVANTRAIFLWIPHPRSLRRWIGEGGEGVVGTRFTDLGQLFACVKFRRASRGVAEIASAYYGQFLEQWLGHRWGGACSACRRREAAPVGIVRYSPANRLRVAQKFARKILADYPRGWVVQTVSGILARKSREFILFAERM